MTIERPRCECHGEVMVLNGHFRGKQRYRCSVRNLERMRRMYDEMTGYEWNRRLLRLRRYKALRRREKRGALPPEGRD